MMQNNNNQNTFLLNANNSLLQRQNSQSNPNLSPMGHIGDTSASGGMSNLSQGNLMRNPGSDIDLAALYNNDSSKSMGFSLPNVPWPSAAGPATNPGLSLPMNNFGVTAAPQFQMGQSNLPIRTAPIPPTPTIVNSNVVPQIMVTQDQDFSIFEAQQNVGPSDFNSSHLEVSNNIAIPNGNSMASDNLSVDPMAMFANMNNDPFQTDINKSEEIPDNSEEGPKKSTLKKVDSFVSYTEPGPIQAEIELKNTSTEDFMAILKRNSAILQQATEKKPRDS